MATYEVFNPNDMSVRKRISYWWREKGPVSTARAVFDLVRELKAEQKYLEIRFRRGIELYENLTVSDLDAWQFSSPMDSDGPYQYNLVESVIDTIHAEVITNQTKPQFVTFDGDWNAQHQAKRLTQFAGGLFADSDIHDKVAPAVARDALVLGTGIAKVYVNHEGKVKAHRIEPWSIIVDDVEAANCPPQQMFETRLVSRTLLKEHFADYPDALRAIDKASEHVFQARPSRHVTDVIRVIEGWKLGTEDSPGRHVICVEQYVLLDEPYEECYFPFAVLKFKERTKGWWGKGVAESIQGHQRVVNALRDKAIGQIQTNAPFIAVPPGARIKEADLTNIPFRLIECDPMPQQIVGPSIPDDLFRQLQKEEQDAASMVGVNMVAMKAELPPGMNGPSGKALRIYNDIKSKRYMRFERAYERWHIEIAKLMIDAVEEYVEKSGTDYKVNYSDKNKGETLSYNDIDLPSDSFVIRAMPSNFLSDTPSGRLADIQELAQIYPEMRPYLITLLQNPDIESVSSHLGGESNAINRIMDALIETNDEPEDYTPIPQMNLQMALELSRQRIVEAYASKISPDRLGKLIRWQDMVMAIIEQSQPAIPPMPQAMPQQPAQPMTAEMPNV